MKTLRQIILVQPIFISTLMSVAASAETLTLEKFIDRVVEKSPQAIAFRQSIEANQNKEARAELEFSTAFFAEANQIDDKAGSAVSPTYVIDRTQLNQYSLGLQKKFSTGTSGLVKAAVNRSQLDLTTPAGAQVDQSKGSLSLSLSQQLWKNSFGYSDRLKLKREKTSAEASSLMSRMEYHRFLMQTEALFWDLVYNDQEMKTRTASLERAERILKWVQNRVSNGIGDTGDLLNAQALVAQRKLQLKLTKDQRESLRRELNNLLGEDTDLQVDGDLARERNPGLYVEALDQNGQIVSWETFLISQQSEVIRLAALETRDSLRPEVALTGAYQTNVTETSVSRAANDLDNNDKPTVSVGVKLTWLLDMDSKDAVANSARLEALSAQNKLASKLKSSQTDWSHLLKTHKDLIEKIEIASLVGDLQMRRAAVERDKLSKGRSISSQVITAEQESDEANLNLSNLQIQARKLETQGRLFVKASSPQLQKAD